MKTLSLNYYQDSGHGWVKISIDKLKTLGIADKVSRYSYMRDNYAYLEEDCDASTLFKSCDTLGIKIKLKEFHTNKQSKIRNYCSYNHKNFNAMDFMQFLKDSNRIKFINIGE